MITTTTTMEMNVTIQDRDGRIIVRARTRNDARWIAYRLPRGRYLISGSDYQGEGSDLISVERGDGYASGMSVVKHDLDTPRPKHFETTPWEPLDAPIPDWVHVEVVPN
jgi:hypothetical protein